MYRPTTIFTGTPAGKKPLERPSRRSGENIRMDSKEIVVNTRNLFDTDYWRALVKGY